MSELLYQSSLAFTACHYLPEAESWQFQFGETLSLRTESLWRLLKGGRIIWTSRDQGQSYGSGEPIRLEEEISATFSIMRLREIRKDPLTQDLRLLFTQGYSLEVIVDSSGYESWELEIEGKTYVSRN